MPETGHPAAGSGIFVQCGLSCLLCMQYGGEVQSISHLKTPFVAKTLYVVVFSDSNNIFMVILSGTMSETRLYGGNLR